jgi:hypothetical protein
MTLYVILRQFRYYKEFEIGERPHAFKYPLRNDLERKSTKDIYNFTQTTYCFWTLDAFLIPYIGVDDRAYSNFTKECQYIVRQRWEANNYLLTMQSSCARVPKVNSTQRHIWYTFTQHKVKGEPNHGHAIGILFGKKHNKVNHSLERSHSSYSTFCTAKVVTFTKTPCNYVRMNDLEVWRESWSLAQKTLERIVAIPLGR